MTRRSAGAPTGNGIERLVVNFHGLGAAPCTVDRDERRYWCTEGRFEAILDALRPLSEASGVPTEITFDDGNASDIEVAMPLLAKRGLTASFFVCAGRIGQPGYLDGSSMRAMLQAGMRIGSHGWHHVDWRQADDATLDREIQGALDEIGAVAGCAIDEVGVPFGSYDRRVLSRLRRSAVRVVYTSDGGRAVPGAWLVPRLSYSTAWCEHTLRDAATRVYGRLARAERALVCAVKRWR